MHKNAPLMDHRASPRHVLVAPGSLLGAFRLLLNALGALLGALGALLRRFWALLGASWTPPGRLLDATWKKGNSDLFFGLQLGAQNPPKLAPEPYKIEAEKKTYFEAIFFVFSMFFRFPL